MSTFISVSKKGTVIKEYLTLIETYSIKKYFDEIKADSDACPLSADEERTLFAHYFKTKSESTKVKIIKSNLRFVITLAKQFKYPKANIEDIINEGNIGMIMAIDKFDMSKEVRFLTFATYHIRQQIQNYINQDIADMVVPQNKHRIQNLINKAKKIIMSKDLYPYTINIVDTYMEIKLHTDPELTYGGYDEFVKHASTFTSLNDSVNYDESKETEMCDTIGSEPNYETDFEIKQNDLKFQINRILDKLNGNERTIVEYTYGLNGRDEKTLDQIAEMLGYTRERIGQILTKSIENLKQYKHVIV